MTVLPAMMALSGDVDRPSDRRRIGEWLRLLLCVILIVGQPLGLALIAASSLDAVTARGLPALLVLLTRVAVAAFGMAAGLALLRRRPAAIAIARISLTASAATDVFVILTPYFPSNRVPGDEPLYVAVSLGYYVFWMMYLWRLGK